MESIGLIALTLIRSRAKGTQPVGNVDSWPEKSAVCYNSAIFLLCILSAKSE